MRGLAPALIVSHLAVAGGVYALTPRDPVDTVVKHEGYFSVTTSHVLTATVESLRAEAKLQVYSFKSSPQVVTDRTRYYLFGIHQRLIVPATVNYYLDLSRLAAADMRYDVAGKTVTVTLPDLTIGDVAFEPEKALTLSGGLLSYSDDQVDELRKLNYFQARRAVIAQAQQPGLLEAAKRQAITDVEHYFSIPLKVAGMSDLKVTAVFR